MKKTLLTLLCCASMPYMAMAAEMPEYCAGTAPNNSEGNHYAANSYAIMVNGEEQASFNTTSNITDLTATTQVELHAGDEITFTLSGGFHLQWGVANLYIDWNANGDFTDDGEMYTIYENLSDGDLSDYATSTSFDFTSPTPIVVPMGIANGPVAMRIISGEAKQYNSIAYDPCITVKRGKMITLTAMLYGTADFAVPSHTDYEHLSALTFSTADGTLEAGSTVALPFGTEITVNATPAEGYEIASITVLDEPVENGGSFAHSAPLTKDDIDIIVGQEKYALTVANEMNFNYTLTKTTGEEVNAAQILEGTDLKLTVDVPHDQLLTAVMLGDTEIHAADGAYTFTMPANNVTLSIQGREKQIFTITIEQPEAGGTLVVNGLKKTDEGFATGTFASGDKTLEGEMLTLSFEREPGYTFVKYLVNSTDFNGTSLEVTDNVTIGAVVEEGVEYPAMTRFYTNGLNQQNRYIKKVTTSGTDTPVVFEATSEEDLPFVAHQGPKENPQEEGTVIDKTAVPIVVEQGTESFTYSFDVWTNTISTTIDGTAYSCGVEIDWTQLAYYVDWNRNGEFTDAGEYVTRETGNMTRGKFSNQTTTKTVTIPEGTKPGIYRMRLLFYEPASSTTDWTLSVWDNCQLRNGVAYDFNISIVPAEFANERTITIASEDETLGSVAFDEYEGTTVSTKNKNVSMVATPAEGVEMLNWTNGDNEIVSTQTSYIYKGEADASFTAHFGYRLSYSIDGNGTLTAEVNSEPISSEKVLAPGTEVVFTATPQDDHTLQGVTVNGKTVEVGENGEFTVTMTQATEVKAIFVDAQYEIIVNTTGNGSYVAGMGYTDDGMPTSDYESGALIGKNTELFFAAVPNKGEKVSSLTVLNGEEELDIDVNTENTFDDGLDDWRMPDGSICFYMIVSGNVTINVEFTSNLDAIEGVEIDPANGPVEYFNLQGMKIEAKNLVPGTYIVRQGGKTSKQHIVKK